MGPQGEQGPPGKDGITPDMSEYPTKTDYEELQRKMQSLQDNTMDYILGLTNRCDSLNTSIQEKEEEILNLETRIIALENHSGIEFITVFSSGNDTLQKYGESIYTYYNDVIVHLRDSLKAILISAVPKMTLHYTSIR